MDREGIDEGWMTAHAHTSKQPWGGQRKDHLEGKRRQEAREKHTRTTTGYGREGRGGGEEKKVVVVVVKWKVGPCGNNFFVGVGVGKSR